MACWNLRCGSSTRSCSLSPPSALPAEQLEEGQDGRTEGLHRRRRRRRRRRSSSSSSSSRRRIFRRRGITNSCQTTGWATVSGSRRRRRRNSRREGMAHRNDRRSIRRSIHHLRTAQIRLLAHSGRRRRRRRRQISTAVRGRAGSAESDGSLAGRIRRHSSSSSSIISVIRPRPHSSSSSNTCTAARRLGSGLRSSGLRSSTCHSSTPSSSAHRRLLIRPRLTRQPRRRSALRAHGATTRRAPRSWPSWPRRCRR